MIKAAHLCHALGRKAVLHDLDFSVHENDFVLIFGPNGAGKSTLLKLLAGILSATEGDIFIGRKNILQYSKKELARQIAYLPQFDEFNLPLLVRDILLSGRYPYQSFFRKYSCRDLELFAQTVERFALEEYVDRNIQTLSGGEKKKVLLASAFIQDVPLILLQVIKMLREMHKQGKTILLVSHLLQHFFPEANKMLALKNGKLAYFGAREFSAPLFRDIYQVSLKRVFADEKEIIYLDE
jgi:iron complex transport system ATP-binding protein